MRLRPRAGRPLAAVAAAFVAATLIQGPHAWADTRTPDEAIPSQGASHPSSVEPGKRKDILGKDWEKSTDKAWTTSGDADGFHVLAADAKSGYSWHTVATLREDGFDADQWIGNACVTGSGKRLVAVYAPRTFTNKADLFARGGFTAVVDLETGKVTKLPVQASLAYYSPGCGTGEQAVLTQAGDETRAGTRLVRVDAAAGTAAAPLQVEGQVTSAVPAADNTVVAADTDRLIRIDADGRRTELAKADSVPFHIRPDADGGVVFMDHAGNDASVKRLPATGARKAPRPGKADTLAKGSLDRLGLTAGTGGRVFITGEPSKVGKLPGQVKRLKAATDATVSTEGQAVIDRTAWADQQDVQLAPAPTAEPRPLAIEMSVPATGKQTLFTVTPTAYSLPADPGGGTAPVAGAGSPSDPVEAERVCSVPRNDPRNQAMQPKPRQVEWAVDQAIVGNLNTQRPADWKNLGMPAYSPQGLFPSVPLNGGGHVPAQIMLGIIAQESNMWQAARYAVPGVTGNPLIGNYYGRQVYNSSTADDWDIHWDKADCGYGLTQQTDGMRLTGATALPYQTQRAVALDYATNIAAGLRTLQQKWNDTSQAGMTLNNGDWSKPENWFYATWAYNSGFHPNTGDGSPWGLGWANNPANPNYPANRKPFLNNNSYADAAHPQNWPYPEKVIGWAAYPIEALESPGKTVPGFRAAWWSGADANIAAANRFTAPPPATQFCDDSNSCKPGQSYTPNAPEVAGEPAGPCAHQNGAGQYDLKCWYNKSATWKSNCSSSCGNEVIRFNTSYPEEADGTAYPPNCTLTGLPAGALVVDDLPADVPSVRPGCTRSPNSGTFTLDFAQDAAGDYPGKVDFHQLGAGFGGHFYFAHTRTPDNNGGKLRVTGTWNLAQDVNGPARVLVHLPDHGAQTTQAKYEIETAKGLRTRVISQPGTGNRWVSIGAFLFNGRPTVRLSNVTDDGTGDQDIAFDAIAFQPIQGTYQEETVEAVAVFDEDQNIDTSTQAAWLGGPLANRQAFYDWTMDRTGSMLAQPQCQSIIPDAGCVMPAVRQAMSDFRTSVQQAGTDPVDHPDGTSLGTILGFANPYTDRPTSATKPSRFDTDDNSYKIKSKATVTFVKDDQGQIIEGSQYTDYEHRTGNTHLPKFMKDLFATVQQDYGIPAPDLSYATADLNHHDGITRRTDPNTTGVMPGRAYAYAGKNPQIIDNCVASLYVSGGSIGYRAMLGADGPRQSVEAWYNKVEQSTTVPESLVKIAGDVFQTFFNVELLSPITGTAFGMAPPIWQELHFLTCADGSIKPNNRPLLRTSWMPDQYLYHNGQAMALDGTASGSKEPVIKGNFQKFSGVPDVLQTGADNPYGDCTATSGQNGNPWAISTLPNSAGTDPAHAHFCLDATLATDPEHSS